MQSLHRVIEAAIGDATGLPFRASQVSNVRGGCIHSAEKVTGRDGRSFFVKSNRETLLPIFEEEARALEALTASATLRVPKPVATCSASGRAALVLEYLDMGHRDGDWAALGRGLARLHRHTDSHFGWPADNWLGETPQINTRMESGIAFLRECRLKPQMERARQRGLTLKGGERLLNSIERIHGKYRPRPSLLHGDLWAGNAGFLRNRTPVIFDPAAHYGDREADLAMTELFGGFPNVFYEAYQEQWPLEPGYHNRKHLHLLYHILNHFNLFGGSYGQQAETLVDKLLRSLS